VTAAGPPRARLPRADEEGIHLPADVAGTYDVLFDDVLVWSIDLPARDAPTAPRRVPWPRNMRPWLDGRATVVLRRDDEELDLGEVGFGNSHRRVALVDERGVPVTIDKWGIIQRPFAGRGREVVAHMVEVTQRILTVLEQECGIHAWLAFGSLLGAVRSGGVIGHDSDIDLAYLSDRPTPAAMAEELFAARRALVRHGFQVANKTGSFLTIRFIPPDRSVASIDLYTCFHLGEYLYETATVRARVPREAIEPLGLAEFEGVPLPAPARPDVLLEASYGPGWRVPDPAFRHRPAPEVTERFDDWFGTVMRDRRDWEVYWRDVRPRRPVPSTGFPGWVADRLPAHAPVVDLGTGDGADALELATRGFPVTGLDYARGAWRANASAARRGRLPVTFDVVNLYDQRDAVTGAALLVRRSPRPSVLYTRSVVDALAPDGRDNLWRFADMLLRGGGSAFIELEELAAPAAGTPAPRFYGDGGRRYPVRADDVVRRAAAHGARVREREVAAVRGPQVARRHRLVLDWPPAAAR
jgi:hypothetical protein